MTRVAEHDYDYTLHPRAIMMPERSEQDYEDLKAGIRINGLQYPIEVQRGTRYLLRGRHRLRACKELGHPLKVLEVDIADDEVAIYTGAEAATRPGLTATQKSLVALEVLPECEKRAADRKYLGVAVGEGERGKATVIAAGLVGVSPTYVELALRLQKKHPDVFERVRQGELDLSAARRELEGGKDQKKPVPKEDRFLAWRVPDYLRQRLDVVIGAVGGEALADGVAALLEFIETDAREAWNCWARVRKMGSEGETP